MILPLRDVISALLLHLTFVVNLTMRGHALCVTNFRKVIPVYRGFNIQRTHFLAGYHGSNSSQGEIDVYYENQPTLSPPKEYRMAKIV